MKSKTNSTKLSSSVQQGSTKPEELWLLGNINAVVKITRAIACLEKAILSASQDAIPSLVAKKSLFYTANTYLFMSRDILSKISTASNTTPAINSEEVSGSVRSLIHECETMAIYGITDIDYAKAGIYSSLETVSSKKRYYKEDLRKSLQYLKLASHYILLGIQCNVLKDY